MSFRVVIPARFGASRLPGKPLLPIAGEPMLAHVCRRGFESGADEVWVAADDPRIVEAAQAAGAQAALTGADCASGSDRVAELAAARGWPGDAVVVNLQGDEPLMPGALIAQVAAALEQEPGADIATACVAIADLQEYRNPNAVKVVCNDAGEALYFSRAPIPHRRDGDGLPQGGAWRHLGLYAYRVAALRRFTAAPPAALEQSEALEQLRALALGLRILVVRADAAPPPGVDTAADLARVAARLAAERPQ